MAVSLRSVCPRCGKGRLFQSFLGLAARCEVCGEDFSKADSGDGPAFFVMFLVSAIVVPIAFVLQFGLKIGAVATLGLACALTLGLSLLLLRPAKALLFALQWRLRASGE